MKTRRKVDALIKHLGLEFTDKFTHPLYGYSSDPEVTCPDEYGITNRVEALEDFCKKIPKDEDYFVECKTCHCLLKKESAIKGEKYIREGLDSSRSATTLTYATIENAKALLEGKKVPREDTIVQDYFCGRCAPKAKKCK